MEICVTTAALIVAAGRGLRAGSAAGSVPKQYLDLAGVPILRRTLEPFLAHAGVDAVTVVIHPADQSLYDAAMSGFGGKLMASVAGGETRQDSVRLGLESLEANRHDTVLIHDAARPFVSADVISRVIVGLSRGPAVIAAIPVADTLKHADADGMVSATLPRDNVWRAQTPQAFRFRPILDAHRRANAEGVSGFSDDASLAEWAGMRVAIEMGSQANRKITTAEDIAMAARDLAPSAAQIETRVASGFDVHKFTDGGHVWLGGVKIPHSQRLDGHSDADVVLHALTDALLGTIGDGDIGQHFPPSDPQWRGAASHLFLADAARRVAARGGRIVNVDVTILAEAPKIGPHRAAMQAAIGAVLNLTADRIGIKATTTEGLGFTGRREGIAAMATATVTLPLETS
jgi:2-C-methyl-D-erythritol 4-phosphate cytidylyltransferase / 2-C-methyl-D-erythritol 2,4-cyclodiphosphate synthase